MICPISSRTPPRPRGNWCEARNTVGAAGAARASAAAASPAITSIHLDFIMRASSRITHPPRCPDAPASRSLARPMSLAAYPGESQLTQVRFWALHGRLGKRVFPPCWMQRSMRARKRAARGILPQAFGVERPAGRARAARGFSSLLALEQQPDQRHELFFALREKVVGREHHGLARAANALEQRRAFLRALEHDVVVFLGV